MQSKTHFKNTEKEAGHQNKSIDLKNFMKAERRGSVMTLPFLFTCLTESYKKWFEEVGQHLVNI